MNPGALANPVLCDILIARDYEECIEGLFFWHTVDGKLQIT